MKIIAMIISIGFTLPNLALAKDESAPEANCTVEEIQGALLEKAPKYSGVVSVVNRITDIEKSRPCLELLSKTPLGSAALERGRKARLSYLDMISSHFPNKGDQALILNPDEEIIRRLQGLMESGRKKLGQTKPKPWELDNQALSDTKERFHLPQNWSLENLQSERYTAEGIAAMEYFQRRRHQLEMTLTSTGPSTVKSVESFKSQMVEKLLELRIRNLLVSAKEASDLESEGVSFAPIGPGENLTFKIRELTGFAIQVVRSAVKADHVLTAYPAKDEVGGRNWAEMFDWRNKSFYEYNHPKPQFYNFKFRLVSPTGKSIIVDEEAFNVLIYAVNPKRPADYFQKDYSLKHRFRIEAGARDVLLANAVQTLRGEQDQSLESLFQRLYRRHMKRVEDESLAQPYLSHQITTWSASLEDTLNADLLWYGWGQHPQYWRNRQAVADALKVPEYKADGALSRYQRWRIGRREAKEVRRQEMRFSPSEDRGRIQKKRFARSALIALGVLASVDMVQSLKLELPEGPSLPKLTLNLPFHLDLLPSLFRSLGLEQHDFNSWPDFYNTKIPDKKEQSGPPKTLGDPHNPTNSPYLIEILHREPGAPMPRYFNFATAAHLPKAMIDSNSWDDDFRYSRFGFYYPRNQKSDLDIDVNVKSRALNGRVGLVQIQGYKLTGLELFDGWHAPVDSDFYHVFEIKGNRQLYARVLGSAKGPFTFRAHYTVDPSYATSKFDPEVSPTAVSSVNDRLRSSGFTSLSYSFTKAMETLPSIRLSQVANLMQESGVYTFKNETWTKNSKADPVFKPFTQFLNGGVLFYQCTGSNVLLQTTINEMVQADPNLAGVKSQHLVGYVADDQKGTAKGSLGHMHTVVFDAKEHYLEIDATPAGSPGARPVPARPRKLPTTDDYPAIRGVLPQRFTLQEPKWVEDESEVQSPPAPQKATQPQLNKEAIERLLVQVAQLRQISVEAFQPIFETESWLKNVNFSDIPGVRYIVLSHVLLDGFRGGVPIERIMQRLSTPKMPNQRPRLTTEQAKGEMNEFFKLEFERWVAASANLDRQATEGKNTAYEFLVQDPLRTSLRELAQLLSAYQWGDLLQIYRDALSQTPCEKALAP